MAVMYRVLCWDYPRLDSDYFDDLKEAEQLYHKMVKEEPYVGWRLYEYIDDETENCLESTDV
jgi:hypothetical protein